MSVDSSAPQDGLILLIDSSDVKFTGPVKCIVNYNGQTVNLDASSEYTVTTPKVVSIE